MNKKFKIKIWDEFNVPIVGLRGDLKSINVCMKKLKKKYEN